LIAAAIATTNASPICNAPLTHTHPPAAPTAQAANPGLRVSYTLPVLPAGLTADGVDLLRNTVSHGVQIDVLNIMTMDYGDSAAPGGGSALICAARTARWVVIQSVFGLPAAPAE
jgi:hypothetical protein